MGTRGLRNAAIVTFFLSMAILFLGGYFAMDQVPPIPETSRGGVLTTGAAILRGQGVYQRTA